ncbi:MAG: hypothetical protein K0Q95_1231 [Bacteroidota bacterium]|jgi:hypothetical protein|nr:hypothetical protein [Bacteroidota bacterium]
MKKKHKASGIIRKLFLLRRVKFEKKLLSNHKFFTFEKQNCSRKMKRFTKILFLFLLALIFNSTKSFAAPVKGTGTDTDTSMSLKSNIAIFKMMTSPAAPVPQGKSLKKAGSVARTSNSHTTVPIKSVPEA